MDMWSVGVIIYVLLAGYPPFHDKDQNRMFRTIKKGRFEFHNQFWGEVSAEAKVRRGGNLVYPGRTPAEVL